ncbi:hypothetical protein EPO15_06690 [bacterium]|nr:MAG: hypothetical protein EPO15_06690 [bacterium]
MTMENANVDGKACPLLSQVAMKPGGVFGQPQAVALNFNCIEQKCAWYDKSEKQCAVLSTARWTRRLFVEANIAEPRG